MSNEMVVMPEYREESQFLPVMQVQQAVQLYKQFNQFVKSALRPGVDVATIPGCPKPSLMKAGAEKLSKFFGLSPSFDLTEKVDDWTGSEHGGVPLFSFTYRCTLHRNGVAMGMCEGSCNSWEDKFRYRNSERVCPVCSKSAITKGKEEYGGGWFCYAKKGGCGAKFQANDPAIVQQAVGKIINMEPYTLVNTIQKQAQKRAFVGAVLIACNASDYFTQDIEDTSVQESEEPEEAVVEPPRATKEQETVRKIVSAFAGRDVSLQTLEAYVGRPADEWQSPEIEIMRTCYKLLKSGEKTVDELFAPKDEAEL